FAGSAATVSASAVITVSGSGAGNAATTSAATSPTLRISASAVATVTAFVFFAVLAIVPILLPLMPEACPRHASRGGASPGDGRGQMPASMAGLSGEQAVSEELEE